MTIVTEEALVMLHLASLNGDRVDPARIHGRPADRTSVKAFNELRDLGLLDGEGWMTALGRDALGEVQP
jgi:HrpA-like RNA helicase